METVFSQDAHRWLHRIAKADKYDIITLQQVSGLSGRPLSYFPYITNLADYVRKKQPNVKLYFHKTWSYEIGSTHPLYMDYICNQKEMYRRLCDATVIAAKIINANVIPTGDIIKGLRENSKEFNYECGGISLCRDGYHLSFDYGRFAAASVWYKTLT